MYWLKKIYKINIDLKIIYIHIDLKRKTIHSVTCFAKNTLIY